MAENVSAQLADDAIAYQINIFRVEAGMRKKTLAALEQLEANILGILAQNKDLAPGKKKQLNAVLEATKSQVTGIYKQIAAANVQDLEGVASMTSKAVAKNLSSAVGVSTGPMQLSANQCAAIANGPLIEGSPMEAWWEAQVPAMQLAIAKEVQQGMFLGEGIDELARRIRGTKKNNFQDGIIAQGPKRKAEAIVRTAVQSTANAATLKTLEESAAVKGIEWVSTLDTRTTPTCRSLDGLQWRLPDYAPIGHDKVFPGPTAHWGCRSTQIAVVRSWDEIAGRKLPGSKETFREEFEKRLAAKGFKPEEIEQIEARQRASMDGQVSGTLDFDAWARKKGDPFIQSLLGPGRFKLWKAHKLTMRDLTDQKGRELTIAQLTAAIEGGTIPPETEGQVFSFEPYVAPAEPQTEAQAQAKLAEAAKALEEANAAKLAARQAEEEASATISEIMDAPEKDPLTAAAIREIQKDEPDLSAIETLAKAQAIAKEKQAAIDKANKLNSARKKLLKGDKPSAAEQAVIDSLTGAELENWHASIAAASAEVKAKVSADALHKAVNGLNEMGEHTSPGELQDLLGQMEPQDAAMFATVQNTKKGLWQADTAEFFKAALQSDASAEPLEIMLQGWGDQFDKLTPAQKAEIKALDAKIQADKAAATKLADIAKNAKGNLLKQKALAQEMGLSVASLNNIQPSKFDNPQELLAKVEALAKEKQEAINTASKLSQAKKKTAAGKKLAPAEQAAVDNLKNNDPAAYGDWVIAVEEAKAKLAAEANAAVAPPPIQPLPSIAPATGKTRKPIADEVAVPEPSTLTFEKELGGSTGAKLYRDASGKRWVVKKGASPAHVRSEMDADNIYRALGFEAPQGAIFETSAGPVKVTEFLEGARTLQQLSLSERAKIAPKLREGMAVDAVLGNWDVVGLSADNVMVTPDGRVWRIDNGGALAFRAQGAAKSADQWTDYPDDLWTLRDRNKNGSTGEFFGDMSIFDVARSIDGIDWQRIESMNLPPDTKARVMRRAQEAQHLATRALDFERDKYTASYTDALSLEAMTIRKKGLLAGAPTKWNVQGTYTVLDENGRNFGNLRSSGGSGGAQQVQMMAGDFYANDILTAVKSTMHKATNGLPMTDGTAIAKANKAIAHKADLLKLATAPQTTQAAKDKAEMAKLYLKHILELETAVANPGTVPASPTMFAAYKPTAAAPVADTRSVVQRWEQHMNDLGISPGPVREWLGNQAGDSWTPSVTGAKYAYAQAFADPEKAFYWKGNKYYKTDYAKSKQEFKAFANQLGGEDKAMMLFTSYHAMVQEVLSTVQDAPWIDSKRRAALLIRTVDAVELAGSGKQDTNKSIYTPLRGTTESHSIWKSTGVHGHITTITATPFSRIHGLYWLERIGGGGSGSFCGDGEAEFAANTSGIPTLLNVNYTRPALDKASQDAATWGAPIDHLNR